MSESESEQGRDPDEPAVRDDHDAAGGGERAAGADDAGAGDGFPAEDVMPEDPDPDLDVMDPFGVGEDRDAPEEGGSEGGASSDEGDPA
ncbi:hypothetical protein GCM10028777_14280 [Angustibacter speluncae]